MATCMARSSVLVQSPAYGLCPRTYFAKTAAKAKAKKQVTPPEPATPAPTPTGGE